MIKKSNCSVCGQEMFPPLLDEYESKSAIKKINDILAEHCGYDYDKMINTLEEILRVIQNFKKYDENPEKYQGKCPKEI